MMLGMVAFALYKSEDNAGGLGRKLSAFEGCDDVKIDAWEDGSKGALWHVFLMFYVFCALAVICDDYFCESLEKISEGLGLSPDVAGATFMAAGSSAPELFVSMADNVFAEETKSLGVGTIIGEAEVCRLFFTCPDPKLPHSNPLPLPIHQSSRLCHLQHPHYHCSYCGSGWSGSSGETSVASCEEVVEDVVEDVAEDV